MEDFRALLKNSKFLYLWISQILSQLTIHIMNFILLIRIFNQTGSTIATSLLWISYALPALLVGPFAAALIDIYDKRKILMISNLLQAVVILGFALTYEGRLFLLYGVAFAYSFLNHFYVPSELASLPSLVIKKNLPQSNGLFFLTQTAALIVGFGVAGLLVQVLGFDNTLFLSAGFLFLAFISVSFLPQMKGEDSFPKAYEQAIAEFFKRIVEGYMFIKKHKGVLYPFLLLMGFQVALVVLVINMPLVATDILKVSANASGLYVALPAGVGSAIGALTIPRLLKRGWRKKRSIETFLVLITTAVFLLAFLVPELEPPSRILFGELIIILGSLFFVGVLIPTQTYLQEVTPGGLRGRVFGNYWFLVTILTILPVLFSGALTELFGIRLLLFLVAGFAFAILMFSKKYGPKMIEEAFSIKKK